MKLNRVWLWFVNILMINTMHSQVINQPDQLAQKIDTLVKQYQALLATEGVTLSFQPDGITRLAHIAFDVNERTENIGARRLATVMERLLDEIGFDAPNRSGQSVTIDAALVDARLGELAKDEDLSRYVL